jgi:hypothetical protein
MKMGSNINNFFFSKKNVLYKSTSLFATNSDESQKMIFLKNKEKRRKQKEKPYLRETQVTKLPNLKQM